MRQAKTVMNNRDPLEKALVRERRNRMLDSAAAGDLSLTDGVREMRAISGMTPEKFARHRGVSARIIKALELGQGNPTLATLNRIGQFFGLKVAFIPAKRTPPHRTQPMQIAEKRGNEKLHTLTDNTTKIFIEEAELARQNIIASMHQLSRMLNALDDRVELIKQLDEQMKDAAKAGLRGDQRSETDSGEIS